MQTLTPKTASPAIISNINTSAPVIDRSALPKQIAYLVLNVTDMAKALDFYKNVLGLAISSESATWSEISMGVTLALKLVEGTCSTSSCSSTATTVPATTVPATMIAANTTIAQRTGLVFNVVNAQKSYDVMKSLGIKLLGEPIQGCSEGSLKFSFEDPFGNIMSAYGSK
jgi:catechol 2,3-dioxygenase-like lactoylglutathione lyase family enzyme